MFIAGEKVPIQVIKYERKMVTLKSNLIVMKHVNTCFEKSQNKA